MNQRLADALNSATAAEAIIKVAAVAEAVRAKKANWLSDMTGPVSSEFAKFPSFSGLPSTLGGYLGEGARRVGMGLGGALPGAGIGAISNLILDQFRAEKKKRGMLRALLEGGGVGAVAGGTAGALGYGPGGWGDKEKKSSHVKRALPEWATSLGDTISSGASSVGNAISSSAAALPDWAKNLGSSIGSGAKAVWDDPAGKASLIGMGIGGGLGGLTSLFDRSRRKRPLSNILTGGLLGGLVGGGGALAYKALGGQGGTGGTGGGQGAGPQAAAARAQAATQAQSGYSQLGQLGFEDKKLHEAAKDYREGRISQEEAKTRMESAGGGKLEQFRQILPATLEAGKKLDFGTAAAHLDAPGLKNISTHFDTSTATQAIAANTLARQMMSGGVLRKGLGTATDRLADMFGPGRTAGTGLGATAGQKRWNVPGLNELSGQLREHQGRLIHNEIALKHDASARAKELTALGTHVDPSSGRIAAPTQAALNEARRLRTERLYTGKDVGMFTKATGGLVPTLAMLAPLIAKEWGSSGYRSGEKPIMSVLEANKILAGQ